MATCGAVPTPTKQPSFFFNLWIVSFHAQTGANQLIGPRLAMTRRSVQPTSSALSAVLSRPGGLIRMAIGRSRRLSHRPTRVRHGGGLWRGALGHCLFRRGPALRRRFPCGFTGGFLWLTSWRIFWWISLEIFWRIFSLISLPTSSSRPSFLKPSSPPSCQTSLRISSWISCSPLQPSSCSSWP